VTVARPNPGGPVLVVTNDFPPRPGGIQTFLYETVSRLAAEDVVVYTSRWRGWEEFDRQQPFRVVRAETSVLLPTPTARRGARRLLREHRAQSVWFGAAAPLGLMATTLRDDGARRLVATTHGHEVGWASVPGGRALLRRIVREVDVLTYLSQYTGQRLRRALGGEPTSMVQLAPGVDPRRFQPGRGDALRRSLGLDQVPVVVCVSRLMPRKGQDGLIRALPELRRRAGDVRLLLVGGGPSRPRLQRLAAERGVADAVHFTGSVPAPELPAYYGCGDVFAMPCRTRLGGLDVEGLGIVFLEAAACGLPVVAGDAGGAPDAVLDGESGYVVDGRDITEVTERLAELLADPAKARAMGQRGRQWVQQSWSWQATADRLGHLLAPGR
jgi:phosphatidylinositol alpha-1,6-mannosyltransferase